jgi:Protein of unknown function (DUF3105)
MSISTPAGQPGRQNSRTSNKAVAGAGRPGGSKAPQARTGGGRPGGGRPSGGGGKGPRKPVTPVKVSQGRNWGPIALFVAVGVIAIGIVAYGGWAVYKGSEPWNEKVEGMTGLTNFREQRPDLMEGAQHQVGPIKYDISPPVAGPHNGAWQRCMGNVYDAPIASEHAVHSLEHGAVWVTYRPDLPKDQVDALAAKVNGQEYMLMSPFEGLDVPISLQAWGYQLKVDNASDSRVDEFIKSLRVNASIEPGAVCQGGITATGTTPREVQTQQ